MIAKATWLVGCNPYAQFVGLTGLNQVSESLLRRAFFVAYVSLVFIVFQSNRNIFRNMLRDFRTYIIFIYK